LGREEQPVLTQILLDSYLGRHISEVCPNGYADDANNHCAHFVNHVLGLSFGVTCHRQDGANLRVHETFDQSPNTRELNETPVSIEALIFISAPQNFIRRPDGAASLSNVPRKHIGLFLDGVVWHYSNSRRQVIKQILAEFIRHYPSQVNALWVGDLPPGSAPTMFSPRPARPGR
jgi:hypothetical protein